MATITRLTAQAKRWLVETDITRELGDRDNASGWISRVEAFIDALSAGTNFVDPFLSADVAGWAHVATDFFTAAQIAKFQDAWLAATDVCRAKIAAGFFDAASATSIAHFAANFFTNAVVAAKFAAAAIDAAKLNFQPCMDLSRRSRGYIYFNGGNQATAQTFTLQGRTYGLYNTAGMGGGLVDVEYDMQATGGFGAGPWTPVQTAVGLAACINSDPDLTRLVDATIDLGGAGVSAATLVTSRATAITYTLATTLANSFLSAVNMVGGVAAGDKAMLSGVHPIVQRDVDKMALAPATSEILIGVIENLGMTMSAPVVGMLAVQDANGIMLLANTLGARVALINANNYGVFLRDPSSVLVNTNIVTWFVTSSV